ncbi:endosome-associated-trafficking regulator 1 isoform X1 [Tachysurus fulvidraco]|uniref:endosome-associated-trafficking regulator 1 isoform X1 n=1 Tax=Tachysurus fulvidraco TaxID=1234273 RepID=UPI000F4D4038|nr:endosome-associated-trafficking regulator 1 isoform X1 [Tachysurus fulvidraco]XP_027001510.1 endosome-associated-trafficking regulator 1 isoform X1 [Tachysurus fulvidraco]XP_047674935.1 endosome-associated-trafficking regulator 1 isoform X1 [Tachysurus fulvidraco]
MSKHKTSKKKLIIEDDEPKEDGEELNPFSFKEFIRSKNQHPNMTCPVEKNLDGACSVEDVCKYASGFKHSQKGHFFTDPSLLEQSFDYKPEDEWTESYQPSCIDQVHKLGMNAVLEGSAYLDHSLLSCEDETVKEWELQEDFSPQRDFHRRSTGSYEGDEETSVVDLTFQVKNSTENGISYQEKLREENSQLRKHIRELLKKSEVDSTKIRQLTDELHNRNLKEEREAKALESMVQSVEENLQLMTKRAVKAESSLSKLKQEVQQLQSQLDVYRCENERLHAGETAALTSVRQNAQVASKYLIKVAQDAETSIKQLLTGRETLCLVSELLSSIDKITEIPK